MHRCVMCFVVCLVAGVFISVAWADDTMHRVVENSLG